MRLLNTGLPRQNIENFGVKHREKGQVQAAAGLMFLLFLCVILAAQTQTGALVVVSHEAEDALAAACLASALADVEEYGISHRILIRDFDSAYEIFCMSLKENLKLNEMWEKDNGLILSGRVRVNSYILYNVFDGLVLVCGTDENGNRFEQSGLVGDVFAPNGAPIETTSVYGEISFPVRFFPGAEWEAHKGKLVDICPNE